MSNDKLVVDTLIQNNLDTFAKNTEIIHDLGHKEIHSSVKHPVVMVSSIAA